VNVQVSEGVDGRRTRVLGRLAAISLPKRRSTTSELAARIAELEEHMRRVLLIVGAAGTMLSEVRRDDEGQGR